MSDAAEISGHRPSVEFLWWSECPSWERALDMLREEMRRLDLDPAAVRLRKVDTDADAEGESFVGSPTIRIDGRDVQPTGDDPIGLSCRVYRRRDGRISPLPDPAELRDALRQAIEGDES